MSLQDDETVRLKDKILSVTTRAQLSDESLYRDFD